MHVRSLWISSGFQNKQGFYLSAALNSWKRSVLYAIRNECMNCNYAKVRQRSPAFGVRGHVREFAKTLRSPYANSCILKHSDPHTLIVVLLGIVG